MTRFAVRAGKLICLALAFSLPFDMATATSGSDSRFRLLQLGGYHVKWGENTLGAGATVTYAFVNAPMRFDGARNCRELVPMTDLAARNRIPDATLRAETAAAFRAWEEAANISFIYVDDPNRADIVIGAQAEPVGRAYANVIHRRGSRNGIKAIDRAQVCLNPEQPWKVGFDGDMDVYDLRYTMIHEIGHAIGLDHAGPHGEIMSFLYDEQHDDLQSGDVYGVQLLYGAGMRPMTASSSD